jgi:hypothetical protein
MRRHLKRFGLTCLLLLTGGLYVSSATAGDLSQVVSPSEVKAGLESAILTSVTRVSRAQQSFNNDVMVQAVTASIDWNAMYRHYLKVAKEVMTPHELGALYSFRRYIQTQGRTGQRLTSEMTETLQTKGDQIYAIMIDRLIKQIGTKMDSIKVAYARRLGNYTAYR